GLLRQLCRVSGRERMLMSDHDQFGVERPGAFQGLEDAHHIIRAGAQAVHGVDDAVQAGPVGPLEHAIAVLGELDFGARHHGGLPCGVSLMVTVRLPWATAAALTRTPSPITTVPVRLLNTTFGRSRPSSTSIISSMAMKLMRWVLVTGARTATLVAFRATATS